MLRNRQGETVSATEGELPLEDFLALQRLTYGPKLDERRHFQKLGLASWLEEQLAYDEIDDWQCNLRLRNLPTLSMDANELEAISNKLFDNVDRKTVPSELRQATLIRQIYSKKQLYELMVEFWSDHFNIYTEKGDCYYLKTVDDREVIRKNALGYFKDLLWASAHSPAMLVYLDNQANVKGRPNENYARELLELHSLGINGGYSQQDVMELARCLTGWGVKEHFWKGEFEFKQEHHDHGDKTLLGIHIPAQGIQEAEKIIELLAIHPATARHISSKLIRFFIGETTPASLLENSTQVFLQTRGHIPSVLKVILLEGLSSVIPKYKRPVHYLVSASRILDAETDTLAFPAILQRMGQIPFGWPTPDGYPDSSTYWQGNLMPRWQFSFEFIRGKIPDTKTGLGALVDDLGTTEPTRILDWMATLLLGAPLVPGARDSLIQAIQQAGADDKEIIPVAVAALLAAPAFQWR